MLLLQILKDLRTSGFRVLCQNTSSSKIDLVLFNSVSFIVPGILLRGEHMHNLYSWTK